MKYCKALKEIAACLLIACLSIHPLTAQQNRSNADIKAKVLDDFMAQRFGMFIHWGPVTLRGTEIGWSRGHEVTVDEYDNLYKEFNPVLFSADAWVKAAKDAGMKYLTITSKHHDGFCLWPSAYTEYNIMSTPFKRDVVGELAAACKKQGIKFCIYFTILDWHDANYPNHNLGDTIPDPKADMKKFVGTMKNELTELITKYHPYMLWFDGYWEKPWNPTLGKEIYDHIQKLDPAIIVNNRLGNGNNENLKTTPGNVGDFGTPEQRIGSINMNDPWESCITIANQWSWKPNDKMKTLKESIHTLATTAGGNGNLLYNVGPMMDGRMEARQVKLLASMGAWLSKNGEAIYGTKGGPYKPNNNFTTTRKGNRIYIHLFNGNDGALVLPAIANVNVKSVRFLNGANLAFANNEKGWQISLPATLPDENDAVIVLELDKNAEQLPLVN